MRINIVFDKSHHPSPLSAPPRGLHIAICTLWVTAAVLYVPLQRCNIIHPPLHPLGNMVTVCAACTFRGTTWCLITGTLYVYSFRL